MRIAFIGIGGVGGYFGGKFTGILNKCQNNTNEIYFVARGEHGRKIKENGLILKMNAEGEMICRPTEMIEDIYERIREVITNGIVYPSCVYVGTHIECPGVVAQSGGSCEIIFGKDKEYGGERPDKICSLMDLADIRYKWSDNYLEEIWSKYIFIAAYGLVTASEDKTLGEVYQSDEMRKK